jgi:hypothetical protein
MGSSRKLKDPKSQLQSEQTVIAEQKSAKNGMWRDIPASTIPKDGVAYAKNVLLKSEFVAEGRTGCPLYSDLDLPYLPGYNGYTAYKTGSIITKTAGPDFTASLLGSYFVINGIHYEILSIIDGNNIVTGTDNDDIGTYAGCWIRAKVWGLKVHSISKKIVIHIDTRVFVSDNALTAWTQIYPISTERPTESRSLIHLLDDNYAILSNNNGHFKLNLTATNPYYFKLNSAVPTVPTENFPVDGKATETLTYGRRYLYSRSRIINTNYYNNRESVGALIESDSGTNKIDSGGIDYGTVFSELAVGDESETYGVLDCGTGDGVGDFFQDQITRWKTLDEGSWVANMNGEGPHSFVGNFTQCETLDDIRLVMENAMKSLWPNVTVKIRVNPLNNRKYFRITTGKIDGSTMDAFLATTIFGQDISDWDPASQCGLFGWATDTFCALSNPPYTTGRLIGQTTNPLVADNKHWTHYSIWGDLNIGKEGTDPITGIGNDPEAFAWIQDYPIIKTLKASVGATGICTASNGYFSIHDIGSFIEFENGALARIESFGVYVPGSYLTQIVNVTPAAVVVSQSCCIGGTSPFTATQAGHLMTIVSGYNLVANDVSKPVFWADGTITYIQEILTATTATMIESATKASQAACCSATQRNFYDILSDDKLRARFKSWPLTQRYFEPLPNSTRLSVNTPGFLVAAGYDSSTIYYSQTGDKWLAGYYNPAYQFINTIKDYIKALELKNSIIIVYCANCRYAIDLNQAYINKLPEYGIQLSMLPIPQWQDSIGIAHQFGVCKIDEDNSLVLTNEPAIKISNVLGFDQTNLTQDKVGNSIKSFASHIITMYNRNAGFLIWASTEES